MNDETVEGKTRAEWIALRGKGDGYYGPPEKDIQRAILWFEEKDKKNSAEKEDRRFQAQLDESRRQGSLTRRIASGAVAVSVIGVLVHIWLHFHPIVAASASTGIPQTTS